ncbi:hemin ABC transporter substrate-binding protein [Desertibaculum subflavum]|uniref:hemin ABC transporter substrate-binding protein n=1 Tax=Desertibaculum subflavum TaxID=2268458 RepID=UPI0034D2BF5D
MMPLVAAAIGLLAFAAPAAAQVSVTDVEGKAVTVRDASRVVSVGGALTEIVYALGAESRLVGVDTTSLYPAAARALPQIGYQRTLATEGILSLAPTLVLVTEDAGPPTVLAQLGAAGVTLLRLPGKASADLVPARIRGVGLALGKPAEAEALAHRVERQLAALAAVLTKKPERPNVLFLFATSSGALTVAGRDTAADAMIRLAGGRNAVVEYAGYKPMATEAAIAAAPDVVLATTEGVNQIGGRDAVLALPGFATSPAARSRRLIDIDTLALLGFGPRVAEVAWTIARGLYPDLPPAPN